MDQFIGRNKEISQLNELTNARHASLVILNGRRRIGKSRLSEEFGKGKNYYEFSGLPPRKGITAQKQRDNFMRQFQTQFSFPKMTIADWADIFSLLAKQTKKERVVILFDEISWMAIGDPDFLGKLKIAWDTEFKKNTNLILILCGSVSSWIEKNLLGNTGFLGRPSLHIKLKELPLENCAQFWGNCSNNISAYEKLKYLAVTGGVPRYLELLLPEKTAEENIRRLCFSENGPLFDEFSSIFSDIYGKRSELYQRIIYCLAAKKMSQEEISKSLKLSQGGNLSEYLDDLVSGGFLARDYTWSLETGNLSKLSHYRLKDNYTRFYLKCIYPNREKIQHGQFDNATLSSLPAWNSLIGLQFENLVINNHQKLIKLLNIDASDVVFSNPFFQRKTSRHPGCQIDYLIQTKQGIAYICEIKFTKKEVKPEILAEMQEKMNRLKVPKHTSKRAVLIHVNGVSEKVIDSQFFINIIDFGKFLEK